MATPGDETGQQEGGGGGSSEQPGPAAEMPPTSPKKSPKPGSVLGVTLGNHIGLGASGMCETVGDDDPFANRPGGGRAALSKSARTDPNAADRIAERFKDDVKRIDQQRKTNHLPISATQIMPDQQSMAKDIKRDMDIMLTNSSAPSSGKKNRPACEQLFEADEFQKKMQYLSDHSRTGHFIEHYGTQGRYEGEFLYGIRHGKGVHEFAGEVYDGEWKWDNRHGWGTLSLPDGTQIKGEWQHGKPHGFASIVTSKGGILYEGEFRAGKRHGLGRQLFESGDMYDGGWVDGRLHDRGVYYFTNGDKLYGIWKQGQYDGAGVFHYADGSISRRVYKDGILISVQDYEHASQRFGKTITRDAIHRHTQDKDFPKDIFLLSAS